MYALPANNLVQGTADMMPIGSTLAGPHMAPVEPNASGAMPNLRTRTGFVTGYRSAGKTPKRRYSTKRPEPKVAVPRMQASLNAASQAPVEPATRRMRSKAANTAIRPPARAGVTEVPLG